MQPIIFERPIRRKGYGNLRWKYANSILNDIKDHDESMCTSRTLIVVLEIKRTL